MNNRMGRDKPGVQILQKYHHCNADVSIQTRNKQGETYINLSFRNGCEAKVTQSQYLALRIDFPKKRLYFDGDSDAYPKFKLSAGNAKSTKRISFWPDYQHSTQWQKVNGDYLLQYDDQYEMYYVDFSKK